jgi:hypothetical protein
MEGLEDFWFHVATVLAALWLGVLQWLGINTVRRVRDLEQTAMRREDLKELRDDIREMRRESIEALSCIRRDQSEANERLSRIEGQMRSH